jgi:pimeloyl-ACP methyl ester carboxylesterase
MSEWGVSRLPRRSGAGLTTLVVVVALLAGCAQSAGTKRESDRVARSPASSSTSTATTSAPLPVQPVQWAPCGDLQCGSVTAPVDYANPTGPTLQIAVARHPAEVPGERIGSLVINPGGPGTSGIDDMANELSVLTPELLDRFDIVSFDPRGVERTSPVTCVSGGGTSGGGTDGSEQPIDPVPTTTAAELALLQNDRAFAAQCKQATGPLLADVGTVDTARDLDRIREAIGDAQLTFIGNSYGTLLGASYAELFPTHVRAMVLDSAIDPALTTVQYATDQAASLESEWEAFAAWCTGDAACPWRPVGDPTTALLALLQQSSSHAVSVAGRAPAGPGQLYDALLAGLESQSSWPSLAGALAGFETGNGTAASSMANAYQTGGSTNGADAEQAIDCLDHPVDRNPADYPAIAARAAQAAPIFGPLLTWGLLGCAVWSEPPTRTPAPATDPGAPPILVIGTVNDPVTPYAWSVSLARELTGGVLLTWQGRSHVAYFYSPCVRGIAQSYLVDGTLPAPGATCSD